MYIGEAMDELDLAEHGGVEIGETALAQSGQAFARQMGRRAGCGGEAMTRFGMVTLLLAVCLAAGCTAIKRTYVRTYDFVCPAAAGIEGGAP